MNRRRWLAPCIVAWSVVGTAWAEGRAGTVQATCEVPPATALGQVSCELVSALPQPSGDILVVPIGVATAKDSPGTDELALRLAARLASDLGPKARAHSRVVSRAEALRLARRGLDVALVQAKLSHERFAALLELVRAPKFWGRFRDDGFAPFARARAGRPLDAELREYLPVVPLVVSRVDRSSAPDEPSLALACGDVDRDGALELVSVGRRRVQTGRIVHGKFTVLASAEWASLSEIAPRPLREPLATALILAGGGVAVGLSDRADGLELDGKLAVRARYKGLLPWVGGGCVKASVSGFSEPPQRCNADGGAASAPGTIDAASAFSLARRDGTVTRWLAKRRANGKVELELGARRAELDGSSGAQLALGELNGDGRPELVSSVDTLNPSDDALVVRTLDERGAPKPGFRLPVPSGIRALAVCPSEGATLTPIVVATGDGLWVIR